MTIWSPIKGGWLYGIGKFKLIVTFFAYQQKMMMTGFAWGVVKKKDKIHILLDKLEFLQESKI